MYGVDDALVDALQASIHRRLASKTLEVPRLPQVAGRIIELSNSPNSSLDDVVQAIKTDPVLATRVLTIANSALYAGGARIEDLNGAVLRLGTKAVSDTVFAETIRMKIFSARAYRPILEQSWKLSLGTALACDSLSRLTGIERGSAFLMGLVHDTGIPVLINAVGEHEKQNRGQSLGDAVVEILIAQLHEAVGAHVLAEWGLSEAIVGAARDHHHYRGAERTTPAGSLVFAGNLVCRHLGIGLEQDPVAFNLERVFTDLKLGEPAQIASVLESVEREFQALMSGLHAA